MLLDGEIGDMPKVLKAYMNTAAMPTDPTRCILGNYASGCCIIASLT